FTRKASLVWVLELLNESPSKSTVPLKLPVPKIFRDRSIARPMPALQPELLNRLDQRYEPVGEYFAMKMFPVPAVITPLPKSASPVALPVTTTLPTLSTPATRGPTVPPIEL